MSVLALCGLLATAQPAAADAPYPQIPIVYTYTADLSPDFGSTTVTVGGTAGETRFTVTTPRVGFSFSQPPTLNVNWRNVTNGATGTVRLESRMLGLDPFGGGTGYADSAVARTGGGLIVVNVDAGSGTIVPGAGAFVA